MAIGDSAGLLFKIKSQYEDDGTKQFKKDLKEIEKANKDALTPLQNLGASAGLTAQEFTQLGGIITVAAGAIVGLTAAVVGAGLAIFELAKQASDYGSKIYDAQQKTGLTAATLTTLKLAADSSGQSFEKISDSVSKFQVLLGQAQQGNEKAQKTLEQYGITARDTKTALEQAVSAIGHLNNETLQGAAAAALFKDRTGDVIDVIKQLNGDLAESQKHAQAFGETLSDQDVAAADAFGDALQELKQQATITATKFGLEVAPMITDAMKSITKYIAENQQAINDWKTDFGNAVKGSALALELFANTVESVFKITNDAVSAASFNIIHNLGEAWNVATFGVHNYLLEVIRATRAGMQAQQDALGVSRGLGMGGSLPTATTGGGGSGGGRGGGGGGAKKDDTVQRAKQLADDRLKVQQEKNKAELEELKLMLAEGTISEQEEIEKRQEIEERFFDYKINILKKEMDLIKGNAKETARLNTEITLTSLQKVVQVSKDKIEVLKQEAKEAQNNAAIWEQIVKREIELRGQALELEQHQLDVSKQLGIANAEQLGLSGLPNPDQDERTRQHLDMLKNNPIGGLLDQFKDNQGATAAITTLADAFGQLGQAVGQTVEALVLYGNAGGNLRQVTARILASVASQAAVKAIFELAEGLACLALAFFGDGAAAAAAPMHFAAAAAYGSIAAIAGLAGRAVAGNSFKQAAASTGGSSSTSKRDTSGQGGAFSSFGSDTLVQETGVNRPGQFGGTLTLKIETNDSHIVHVVEKDVNNNGKIRTLILNTTS